MYLLDAKKNFCTVLQPNLSTYSFFVQTDYISFYEDEREKYSPFQVVTGKI